MHTESMEKERSHKSTRKFDGKVYYLMSGEATSKAGADGTAQYWRNRGYLVRIIKEPNHNEWLLYRRGK